ncbi:MAG: serine protease, partial [Gammaproteobacteria bacterium]|nr:serine protease [Gammaproteobacteria bacterium]
MRIERRVAQTAFACLIGALTASVGNGAENNLARTHGVSIGPEADRLIVGFRTTADNAVVQTIRNRVHAEGIRTVQAGTRASDAEGLAQRAGLKTGKTRQLTPSMHVMYLQSTLYGADVDAALKALRADPSVKFAEVDQRRYPQAVPNDPLFAATADATGQWYMMTPDTITPGGDASATDAVSAWAITKGSPGTVIADVDTGIRFDHPDLLRAGFGGRLLPGYDFVAGDQSRTTGAPLGTFLTANDGDGWDPDPSDPGDWISASDQTSALFPSADCPTADSSWHGTRVMGILGALTDNAVGIAGMTWNPYLLPVRALGKCGGYDSDIVAGMQWAAGLSVTGVPDNPYPADIINLSLGGNGSCPAVYKDAVSTLTGMGVLIVASAGNESGAVDAPGNCAGVLAVAGLRNIGTKVGYSSLGPEVGVAAPAGNCLTSATGACL